MNINEKIKAHEEWLNKNIELWTKKHNESFELIRKFQLDISETTYNTLATFKECKSNFQQLFIHELTGGYHEQDKNPSND